MYPFVIPSKNIQAIACSEHFALLRVTFIYTKSIYKITQNIVIL